jgi:FixJ family two-component response regulator/predicted regulator of Ras-like GTPase activity (Roadblock/LC7/MglB family)
MAGAQILVVDSDASNVRALVPELEEAEFVVRGAVYDAGAVEAYQTQTFELVLMYLRAQGAEGMDFLKTITRYDPEALVVVVATDATVDLAVEALKSGAREFIKDPLGTAELTARLHEMLAQPSDEAVRGSLRDLALTSIISVNCNEHNQAELVIRRQGRVGIMYFDNGTIVHASLEDQEGEGVVYELLSWEDGSFSLRQDVPPPKRTVQTDWTGLLLEGMRRIDDGVEDWDEEEEEDEEVDEEPAVSNVIDALMAIEGVEGVVLCSPGGELLGEAAASDPERKAAVTALAGQRSRRLAFLLNAGQPRRVFLTGPGGRLLVVPHGEDYAGVWVSQRSSPEATADEVRTVLRRYLQTKGGPR